LERCAFDGSAITSASFGAGRLVSEYVGCSFDGATLKMGPGGIARFVDCTFENTVIENWFCFAVEVVGCTFSGRLRKVSFNGAVRSDYRKIIDRATNQFERNDFARAKLVDVAFRTGVDLTRQQLPSEPEYTYLKDAAAAVRRARIWFNALEDPSAKKHALGVLRVMEEDVAEGQEQLLMRADDYPRASLSAIRELLAASRGDAD
jgi:hypothetical protein